MPKVNVEQVAEFGHHDIVIVTIANSQYVSGHTIASTRDSESINSFLICVW